jgi:hypothetical protein
VCVCWSGRWGYKGGGCKEALHVRGVGTARAGIPFNGGVIDEGRAAPSFLNPPPYSVYFLIMLL